MLFQVGHANHQSLMDDMDWMDLMDGFRLKSKSVREWVLVVGSFCT